MSFCTSAPFLFRTGVYVHGDPNMKSRLVRRCAALLIIVLAIGAAAFFWDRTRPQYRAARLVRELGGQVTLEEDSPVRDWKVRGVSFADTPVGDADLQVLVSFPDLRELSL